MMWGWLESHPHIVFGLHGFLFIGQRDVHLLERDLVERTRDSDALRLLILAQALAGSVVEFSDRFSGVEAARLEQRLCLVDLLFRRSKDGAAFGLFCFGLSSGIEEVSFCAMTAVVKTQRNGRVSVRSFFICFLLSCEARRSARLIG
jgi:hypothetical protein